MIAGSRGSVLGTGMGVMFDEGIIEQADRKLLFSPDAVRAQRPGPGREGSGAPGPGDVPADGVR